MPGVLEPLAQATRQRIVEFTTHLFSATKRVGTLELAEHGGHGGAEFIRDQVVPAFRSGAGDSVGGALSSQAFDIYRAWEPGVPEGKAPTPLAESIGRGEVVFNTKVVEVSGVPGLNGPDDATHAPLRVTCSTCHNNPNVGNHNGPLSLDIGVTAPLAGDLDVEHLPVYTFQQKGTGRSIKVTDPGRGLITGSFADLGKTKVPGLRDLRARAPYFHNGSARDLETVLAFYEQRFGLRLEPQERVDLLAFLSAL